MVTGLVDVMFIAAPRVQPFRSSHVPPMQIPLAQCASSPQLVRQAPPSRQAKPLAQSSGAAMAQTPWPSQLLGVSMLILHTDPHGEPSGVYSQLGDWPVQVEPHGDDPGQVPWRASPVTSAQVPAELARSHASQAP